MKQISHFTKLSVLLNHILEEKKFQFNLISKTNDPQERTQWLSVGISRLDQTERDMLDELYPLYESVIKRKIKVGCFVNEEGNVGDFRTWTSVLNSPLWAHYGANGEGVVLVFDVDKLIASCKSKSIYDWAIHHDIINYSIEQNEDSNLPFFFNLKKVHDRSKEGIIKYAFQDAVKLWSWKDQLWSYEDEYRILIYTDEEQPIKVDISDSLRAVVFGDRVSQTTKKLVSQYCKENNIESYYVEFDQLTYKYQLYDK